MANVNQVVTVYDVATHLGVEAAVLFVNGTLAGTTNSIGDATLSIPVGPFDLSVKKTGYQTFTGSGNAPEAGMVIGLSPTAPSSTATFHLVINPEDKANGMPLTFDNAGSPVDTNYQIGGIDVGGLTIGSQTITGQVTGFQAISQTFDLTKALSGVIQMIVSSDTGGALSQKQAVVQDPDLNATLLPTVPENLPEFIAPNTGTGTYFTMTQARMYIGDLFIDELNSCQFALQDNKIPIYGYASRFWDAKAQGKSLVQGQFTINFISEGYMVKTLENYKTKIIQSDSPVDPQKAANQQRLLSLIDKLQNPDPNWTPDQFTSAVNEVKNLAAALGADAVNAASAQIRVDRQNQLNSILGLAGTDYANAIYSDIEFDMILQYTGAGRTITRRLEKCTIISNESIMDHSGTPILESYGFIARRLR